MKRWMLHRAWVVAGIAAPLLAHHAVGADGPALPGPEGVPAADASRFVALVDRMTAAVEQIRDYTCVFTRQERVRGELLPMETMLLKHRGPGVCVYMKWIEEPHRGREIIYCEGKYDGRLRVHEGSGIASWMSLSLDPVGSLALRHARRPVTEAGVYNSARLIARGFEQVHGDGSGRLIGVNEMAVQDQPSLCALTVPSDVDATADERLSRTEICIDRERALPTSLRLWDVDRQLVGAYTYSDYHLNVGLGDQDFDVANRAYGF
ncbi:MAG TPA: DUF1571 domain-containing protein [Candidatus Nitrosopolaris sp.]|nr:DUF1571 domain-containing protein [Candidatus Nitrosopolaris sp.]